MTGHDLYIRSVTEQDIDRITEIERASFSDPWSRESFLANIGDGCVFFAACNLDEIVGFAIIALIPPEGELYNIALLPEYRGTGAAKLLFDTVINTAKEKGVEALFLEVRESNIRARKFYEKNGFSVIGVRKNYYKTPTENAIIMSKNL